MWKDNVTRDRQNIVWEEVYWVHLAQDIGQKLAVLLNIKNILFLFVSS